VNAYERLMLEAIPQGFPPPVDNGDGPTACLMRVERQRALWVMAHAVADDTDKNLTHNLSDSARTVAS
jgi:hypothetical protein